MPPLARRNLFHDKVRLAVTLTGIVFAVVLIIVQMGLFLGFTSATAGLIANSAADLWVVSDKVPYLERSVAFSERKLQQIRAIPGVARAEKHAADFSRWKRADGGQENIYLIGFNPDGGLGGPWNLVAGSVQDLKKPDTVIIDEIYRGKLGVSALGQTVEINDRRARVVGFTRGIRSFTTSPYVFATFKNAQDYIGRIAADQTSYILVRVAPGADVEAVRRSVETQVRDVDVHTTREFARMTTAYWMFTTGAGIAVLMAAVLGLVVGVVVVAQTIYATTVDHIREFGTLKAMGAPNRYIYRVILQQALISAVIGYALAMGVSVFVLRGSAEGGASILVTWQLLAAMFAITLLMCVSAAAVSVKKVMTIDPALVFRN